MGKRPLSSSGLTVSPVSTSRLHLQPSMDVICMARQLALAAFAVPYSPLPLLAAY